MMSPKSQNKRKCSVISKDETWDLNVPVSLSDDETVNRIKVLAELGFRHIALNYEVEVPKDNRTVRLPPQSAFTKLVQMSKLAGKKFHIYSRLTLVAEDMSVARILRDQNAAHFDFIALKPLGEQLLTSSCEGHLPVDIISFDVTAWTPLNLRQSLLHASGLICEINYGPMIRDQSTRCSTIAFAQVLTARSKGGGKGLFALSGGARHAVELRPPADVANLADFLSLTARDGWASVVDAPNAAQRRALIRRGIWGIKVLEDEVVEDFTTPPKDGEQPKPKKSKTKPQ